MKNQLIVVLALVCLLAIPVAGNCQEGQDLVEQTLQGSINWSEGVVQAVGIGAPSEKHYGKPSARPMALRAAKLDAMRNILEAINGVRIDGSTIVRDYAVESDIIRSKVEGMIQGAEVVKQEYLSDGTIEITMAMSLRGGFSQLVLPDEIKPLESVKPVMTPMKHSSAVYTGLVVDARGLSARPAMSPKILDETGQEVYGSAFVSREYAVQQGMSGYAKDIAAAHRNQRVTDNPITVKGLRTEGLGRSDIVISNADASALRSASENLSFMKKCRVMIVVD
ncbi:MAG: LPP20 family lipoprotein [Deltaproteobacteria bacterium]|nr:LPP20 family lipoprotein [Deltaproteobacteria bacterium]